MKYTTAAMTALFAVVAPIALSQSACAELASPIPANELNNHPRIVVFAANRLVGRDLQDVRFQPVGRIDSLVIDTTTGGVEFLMIRPADRLQTNGQLIAVPWAELVTPATVDGPLGLKVDLATIAQAPRIDPRLIFELARPEERDRMFGYFGGLVPGALPADGGKPQDRQNNLAAHDRQLALEEHNGMVPDGTAKPPPGSRLVLDDAGVIARLSVLTSTSAATMDDASIHDATGKDIGELSATMIDVVNGRVAYVLVSHGGFLGMDESLSAAPIQALALSPYQNRYRLTVSTATLEHEPALHLTHDNLPSSVSAEQLDALYSRFGIKPYWTGGTTQLGLSAARLSVQPAPTPWSGDLFRKGQMMVLMDATKSGTFLIGGEFAVNRLGFGAMRLTGAGIWGEPADRDECLRTLRRLPELGVNLIDTADSYGPDISEHLIHAALHPFRDMLVATKGGLVRLGPEQWRPMGRPEYLRQQALMSLRFLGLEQIGLWQLHRIDRKVPRDEQFGAIRALLDDGVIRHAGLSEASVEDIEAARKVFPVATVQNRFNLVDRASEAVLTYCEQHQIGFIPWSPLAAGDLAKPGSRLDSIARAHAAAPSQIALAWLLRRSPVILPIPGTSRVSHLELNVAAASIELSAEEVAVLDRVGASPA